MLNDSTGLKPIRASIERTIAAFVSLSSLVLIGCQVASQSPSPVEFIKDPLGIERGIDEYYMPVGKRPSDKPQPTWGSRVQISDDSDR